MDNPFLKKNRFAPENLLAVVLFSILALIATSCEDLPRRNPLDPKNPASERRQLVLIEAFVNDATPYSPHALAALDELATLTSGDPPVVLAYHLSAASFPDAYALPEAKERYNFYVTQDQAVPDVFINGMQHRLQGAASKATALDRYQMAFGLVRDDIAHLTLEAKAHTTGSTLTVEVRCARLGENDLQDFFIQAVAFESTNASGSRFVVRHIFAREPINNLGAGEIEAVSFTDTIAQPSQIARWQIVVFAQENNSKNVLQATLAEN